MPHYVVTVEGKEGRLTMDWEGDANDEDLASEAADRAYRARYPAAGTLEIHVKRIRPTL